MQNSQELVLEASIGSQIPYYSLPITLPVTRTETGLDTPKKVLGGFRTFLQENLGLDVQTTFFTEIYENRITEDKVFLGFNILVFANDVIIHELRMKIRKLGDDFKPGVAEFLVF